MATKDIKNFYNTQKLLHIPVDKYESDESDDSVSHKNKSTIINKNKRCINYSLLILLACTFIYSLILISFIFIIPQSYQYKAPGIYIKGRSFYQKNGNKINFLTGMNIVVKGPPWIPDSFASKRCNNSFCRSFSQADIDYLKNITYPVQFNAIRLSTIWAGAQPNSSILGLDIDFKERLRNITQLCYKNDIYVLFDLHQDVFSSVYCGEGVPMWIFKSHVKFSNRYFKCNTGLCSCNESEWSEYRDSPNFNVLNKCCIKANRNNIWSTNLLIPPILGGYGLVQNDLYPKIAYMLASNSIFKYRYIKYIEALARTIHEFANEGLDNVIGIELFNEPEIVIPGEWWLLWTEIGKHLYAKGLTVNLGISDIQQTILPFLSFRIWMFNFKSPIFYTYHNYKKELYNYGNSLKTLSIPSICTECGCNSIEYEKSRRVSNGYLAWSYNKYCNVPNKYGTIPSDRFGACINGVAGNVSCLAYIVRKTNITKNK